MAEKKRTEVDWQDVRVFLALARHGSLSAAARALSVNHATVARRIQSLEATLGEKLVERRSDRYVLTPPGVRTMDAASHMEAAAQTLGRAGTDAATGLVRVNAPPGLSEGFLIEQLSKLPLMYPGLDIDLATNLRSISLERRQADIAVRVGRPPDGHFVAKSLGHLAFGYYGTDEVCTAIEQGGEPRLSVSMRETRTSWVPDGLRNIFRRHALPSGPVTTSRKPRQRDQEPGSRCYRTSWGVGSPP
jgi:molybdate transport repressor ModE-like protein